MATSYFRERARNPYLRGAPGAEDDPNISPTFSRPMPMAPEVVERPPLRANTPDYSPPPAPSPYELMERERAAYMAQVPTSVKGRILQALTGAGLGFLQGAASNPNDPLAAGIGGAATGGAVSAVSPRTGRAVQFEAIQRPRIEERLASEETQRKKQMATEDRARAIRMDEARIGELQAQTKARLQPPQRTAPLIVPPDSAAIDPATGREIYKAAPKVTAPTRDELTIEPSSGKSFEQIARDSYEARGGDAYVRSKLPAWMRQVLEKGTMATQDVDDEGTPTGKLVEAPADAESIQTAQRALDDAIKRQWEADLQYTRGDVRSRALGARKSGSAKPQGQAPQSGISRPRSQFNSKLFPGLKFD